MVESSAPVDVAFVKGFIVVLSNCDATFPMPPLYQQMSRHGGRNATTNCCNVVVLNATAMIAGNNRQDVVVSTQRLNFTAKQVVTMLRTDAPQLITVLSEDGSLASTFEFLAPSSVAPVKDSDPVGKLKLPILILVIMGVIGYQVFRSRNKLKRGKADQAMDSLSGSYSGFLSERMRRSLHQSRQRGGGAPRFDSSRNSVNMGASDGFGRRRAPRRTAGVAAQWETAGHRRQHRIPSNWSRLSDSNDSIGMTQSSCSDNELSFKDQNESQRKRFDQSRML
eukprot:GHVQ01023221.1.p2 GENE.GHVQ01023221.1~~GHVQ01023221.1.p2  ORF type:complete len:280 (+),score=19.48 GHVQ01023221.1:1991-2830(+)